MRSTNTPSPSGSLTIADPQSASQLKRIDEATQLRDQKDNVPMTVPAPESLSSGVFSSRSQTLIPAPKPLHKPADAKKLEQLLQFVAEGEQDKAEVLIQTDKNLLCHVGRMKDLSGREFKQITAFQYALWAMDYHMWRMIQNYLPEESQAAQLLTLESQGTEHGYHFSLKELTDGLERAKKWECNALWEDAFCTWVSISQMKLPAHVANEYCRADRTFEPCPEEWEKKLPRTLVLKGWDSTKKMVYGTWFKPPFVKDYAGLSTAFLRYNFPGGMMVVRGIGRMEWWLADLKALRSLWKTRTQQFELLKSQLSSTVPLRLDSLIEDTKKEKIRKAKITDSDESTLLEFELKPPDLEQKLPNLGFQIPETLEQKHHQTEQLNSRQRICVKLCHSLYTHAYHFGVISLQMMQSALSNLAAIPLYNTSSEAKDKDSIHTRRKVTTVTVGDLAHLGMITARRRVAGAMGYSRKMQCH